MDNECPDAIFVYDERVVLERFYGSINIHKFLTRDCSGLIDFLGEIGIRLRNELTTKYSVAKRLHTRQC